MSGNTQVGHIPTVPIHVRRDAKGLERGSGGTPQTVGIDGGGLTFDLTVDRNYSDARKRWESQLQEEGKREAIMREAATACYYTMMSERVDPADPEGSREGFLQRLEVLLKQGWEIVEAQVTTDPMLTGRYTTMWAELKRAKTTAEILL